MNEKVLSWTETAARAGVLTMVTKKRPMFHSKHTSKSATSGKLMVFGRGDLMEKFFSEGIKYNVEDYFMHANTADYEEQVVNKVSAAANEGGEGVDRENAEPVAQKVVKTDKNTADFEVEVVNKVSTTANKGDKGVDRENV